MTIQEFDNKLAQTIERLSDPSTYDVVCYEHRMGEPLPSIAKLKKIVNMVREILFPGYFGSTSLRPNSTRHYMGVYVDELYELLSQEILAGLCFECQDKRADKVKKHTPKAKDIAVNFIEHLPEIRRKLVTDVNATYQNDPAAKNLGEVIFCYPAIRAITNYRMAHKLLELNVPLIPRFIAEMAHSETGIDIHPRAQIGESFTIDHGTGVVIGSTCIIGNNVKIYQGVTLGAKSFPLDENGNPIKGIPRHPIVEDDVVIYSGATILGRITIGKGSVIGGNVWVTNSIPPNSKLVQSRHKEVAFIDGLGI
ncbi:serine O-acetyltransferase [Mariniphaga anaerophila]|uniref:serine O-acetyltransferase n=1 Tax=Mariniphaga anaerophila TaxID=1484053 RepID=A0A1M5EVB8_9BACT|nr:serine O-acetyltransferase EpsC [Mariniphaga anaerophila]SHF82972.1 serine O-acetyltransferase [Mariniphaga anaerophila]